jgi:hypothetical protein
VISSLEPFAILCQSRFAEGGRDAEEYFLSHKRNQSKD